MGCYLSFSIVSNTPWLSFLFFFSFYYVWAYYAYVFNIINIYIYHVGLRIISLNYAFASIDAISTILLRPQHNIAGLFGNSPRVTFNVFKRTYNATLSCLTCNLFLATNPTWKKSAVDYLKLSYYIYRFFIYQRWHKHSIDTICMTPVVAQQHSVG